MIESLCLITEDKALMVRFIDWINAVPNGDDTTKLYVTSVDVQAEIEQLRDRVRFLEVLGPVPKEAGGK